MNHINDCFSDSYQSARSRFLAAAAGCGLPLRTFEHPLPGKDGETLALDVVQDGAADADRLLIVSSACHGVEGFCGSGVQVHALRDAALREAACAQGVTLLYLHALNPHGFSHLRRVTNENVDLNRNFQDFSQPLPPNPAYRALHDLLLPETWPPDAANQFAIGQYLATHGMAAFQAAVTAGQYEFADGLFFGGHGPTWSQTTLRQVLRQFCGKASRIGWIDLHTGLGPSGVGERIFAGKGNTPALQRARQWWGNDGVTPITSVEDGSSSSANLSGLMWTALQQECPQAEYTGIALEYGTVPLAQVIHALRADHWLHRHPDAAPQLAAQIHQQMRAAFYGDSDQWRQQIIAQAQQVLMQAVAGLSNVFC
jgi:hypothetical protein